MTLRLDWCSHEAAKFACETWHYSKSPPAGKVSRVGVWEDGRFIGVVIFARGSNKHIGTPFGLTQFQCVELVRVALSNHKAQVSRVLAIACRMLKKLSPKLRLIISFADPNQDHVGTIYQAAGWIYSGHGSEDSRVRPYRYKDGRIYHWRTVAGELTKRGMPGTVLGAKALGYEPLPSKPKLRYLFPLDQIMRESIKKLAKPYPKRAGSKANVAPADQAGEGGVTPTPALHLNSEVANG